MPDIYRPCVGMFVLNPGREVLVGRRIDGKKLGAEFSWQMPQGGIDKGETPHQAAMRELEEEIGTSNVRVLEESGDWLHYDLPEKLQKSSWGGRYKGQKQKWFAMEFLGQDSEININTSHPEFCEWKWVDPRALPDIIVLFKRDIYKRVLEIFKQHLE